MSHGTKSTSLTIEGPAGPVEAYLSGVDGAPGILLYVDAIGLRPQIHEMADRIASWGYVVLAPHVFYRDGSAADLAPHGDLREDGAREAFFASGVMERIGALTPELSAADGVTYLATLLDHAGDGPVGTHGYCMGARLALWFGGQFPDHVAAVGGFHGAGLVTDGPDSPHLSVAGSRASFAFGHADHDSSMPPEAVAALGDALGAAGVEHVNEVYPDAAHGYSMADTSVYDEGATERHFRTLRSLFDSALR